LESSARQQAWRHGEETGGMGRECDSGGSVTQKGGDICIHVADSLLCTAETNTRGKAVILQIKKKYL